LSVKQGLGAVLRASTALISVRLLPRVHPALLPALLVLGATAVPALAQPVWTGGVGGTGTDFNLPANWDTGTVPTSAQTAFFQNTGPTSLSTSANTTLNGITFSAGASSYNLTLGNDMTLAGSVVNSSARNQTISVASGTTLFFQGTAASGQGVNYTVNGTVVFDDASTGGNSAFTVNSQIGIRGDARTVTLGSLSGAGGTLVRNFSTNDITVQVGSLDTSTGFGGAFGSVAGAGALTLEKVGTGTLTLTGTSSHAATLISAGTLELGTGGSLGTGGVTNNAALVFGQTGTLTVANAISGTGTVTQSGSGTTILTGDNTYSGTTTIDAAGTLQIGDGGTTGTLGTGGVTNNGTLAFNRSNDITASNVITGSGGLRQDGAGVLTLGAASDYSGGTVINAGTVALGDIGALGSGGVTLNGGTLRSNVTGTLANAIGVTASTTGTISAAAGQTLTLTGALTVGGSGALVVGSATETGLVAAGFGSATLSSPEGSLRVAGGTLRVDGSAFGTLLSSFSSTTIDSGATLNLNGQTGSSATIANLQGAGTLTNTAQTTVLAGSFAGAITGTGGLFKTTGGTLVLTGTNTYSGTTTINGGTLRIGDGGTTGTLGSGAVTLGGTLAFNRSDDALVVGNAISGVSRLRQIGSGTTTLTGALSYTGGTFVDAGTLVLGDTLHAVTLPGAATIASGATLTLANGSLGSGTITNGGDLGIQGTATAGSATITNTCCLRFSGSATAGTAAITNSSTGNIDFDETSTAGAASITNAGSIRFLATASGGTAAYTGQAGSTVDFSWSSASALTLGSLAGTGAVDLGSLTLTVGGNDTSTTFAGVIADGGVLGGTGAGLTKAGTGTLTLSGANTYTGLTTISAGTLQIGDGGATGTLGSGNVVNNAALAFNRTGTLTVANAISGTGTVTQSGTGTTVLTATNTYSGTTTISAGTLQVGDGGTTGTLGTGGVTNDGTLAFNRTDGVTLGNLVSGTGRLTQAGSGVLTVTAANTYSGGTTIAAGTLQLGDGGMTGTLGSGAVVNNGTLAINRIMVAGFTLPNDISGTGALTLAPNVRMFLTGANSYSGTTTIATGAGLAVGDGGTVGSLGSGAVLNGGQLVFYRSNAMTVPNAISGSGQVAQLGTGTTILTGANTYSGATMINAGTLQIGNGGTTGALGSGNVTNGGALVFNRSDSVTLTNTVSGTGSLTQAGTGNLIVPGTQTYTGATFVNAGRLSVNGSIASSSGVTVASGGTLGGTGNLPGVTVLSGGIIAPGNSIGTLAVAGNLTLAPGSTTQIEVQGPLIDRINVTGTAALGGTLRLLAQGGSYTFNAPYTIVQAGAVTGNFAAVNATGSFGAGVTSTVSTTPTQAQLTLTPAPLVPIVTPPADPVVVPPVVTPPVVAPPAVVPAPVVKSAPVIGPRGTSNQVAVAAAFDRALAGGADVAAFFPLYNLSAAALPRGLDQVSGQIQAVASGMHAQPAYQFLGAILDPARGTRALGDGAEGAAPRYAVWASGFGGGGRIGASGNPGTYAATASGGGVAVGADVRLTAHVVAGLALAGSGATTRLSDGMGRAETNQIQGAVYGTATYGALRLAAAVAYGGMDVTTRRTVPFLGLGDLRGRYTANGVSTRLEAGWRMEGIVPRVALTPSLAFQGSWYDSPNFTETGVGGASAAALAVSGRNQGQSRMELSLRADMALTPTLSGFGRVGWAAYLQRDAGMSARFAGLANSGFTLAGARPDAHAALLSGGVDWRMGAATTLTARVDAELASNSYAVNGTARIRYEF